MPWVRVEGLFQRHGTQGLLDLDVVLLERHAHGAVRINKGFGVIDQGLDLVRLRLSNIALFFQYEPDCRSAQIELFLFGFEPALGKLPRRLRRLYAGPIHIDLCYGVADFQRNLLRLRCKTVFRDALVGRRSGVIPASRFIPQRNQNRNTRLIAGVAVTK